MHEKKWDVGILSADTFLCSGVQLHVLLMSTCPIQLLIKTSGTPAPSAPPFFLLPLFWSQSFSSTFTFCILSESFFPPHYLSKDQSLIISFLTLPALLILLPWLTPVNYSSLEQRLWSFTYLDLHPGCNKFYLCDLIELLWRLNKLSGTPLEPCF